MSLNPNDVASWPGFCPMMIIHDVGRSRDRSTAVVGGICPYGQPLIGVGAAEELPQGLFGSARANALAGVDQRYDRNGLIVADLSNDASYADILVETFGARVIGVQIGRHGNGTEGSLPVYNVGRTFLIEFLQSEFLADRVRLGNSREIRRAYQQLADGRTSRERGCLSVCVRPARRSRHLARNAGLGGPSSAS
jgi:hypothetical protein